MARYITNQELDLIVQLDALTGFAINNIVPRADQMGKEVARNLRAGTTFLKKALDAYQASIDDATRTKLIKRSKAQRVVIRTEGYR